MAARLIVINLAFVALLAGPVYDTETMLTAELDMAQIPRGKYDLDVTGHYARPDVFDFSVRRPSS